MPPADRGAFGLLSASLSVPESWSNGEVRAGLVAWLMRPVFVGYLQSLWVPAHERQGRRPSHLILAERQGSQAVWVRWRPAAEAEQCPLLTCLFKMSRRAKTTPHVSQACWAGEFPWLWAWRVSEVLVL